MNISNEELYNENELSIIIITSNIVHDDIALFISFFNFHINEMIKSTAIYPDKLQ